MKPESHSYKFQAVSHTDDLFLGVGKLLICKAARVVVATCFAIISSVAITSAETVALYGNVPDPFRQIAVSTDLYPINTNVSDRMAQQFVTGELGIVSSISFPFAVSGSLPGVLPVEIWDENSGQPGQKVASVGDIDLNSWTGADFEYQLVTFDSPVTGLEPNTKYYVVFVSSGINVSGFELTYFIPGSADSEGTNNAGKLQVTVRGAWRFASDFRGSSNNYTVMEILEIPPTPLNLDIATASAVSWDSQADTIYAIQSSTDLQTWTVAAGAIEGTGERLTHFFTRSAPATYYRIRSRSAR